MLAIAIGAGACGSSSSGGTSNGSKATTNDKGQTAGLTVQDINPQPVSALKQGGTVKWSLDQYSTQWNAAQIDGPESSTFNVLSSIMPTPMVSQADASVVADPDYITSISQTSTSPQTITAKLNPTAHWSDGTSITEADYAANLTACDGTPAHKGYQCASNTGSDQIKSVSTNNGDKFSVVLVFAKPFTDWKALFDTYFYPAHYMSTAALFNSGYLNKIPVTGGPFGDPQFNKSAQTITVTPDANWWGNKPLLDKIVFETLSSTAANQAYVNGEINYDYDVAVDPDDYKTISKAQDGHVSLAAGPDYRQITVSSVHGFMTDEKVRQAVEMGINRDLLIKADLNHIPWPTVPLDNHFYMNSQAGYQDNTGDLGKYNTAGAEQLLQSDGFTKDSSGYYAKDGKEIDLDFMIPDGIVSSQNEGELTQEMLKQIGIKVHINAVPINSWSNKYLTPGKFDLAPFSWLGTPFPISSALSIYSSPKDGGGQNFTGTANPAVDKLLKQAVGEPDPATATSLTNQADALLYQEVHTITLFQRPQMSGVTNGLANLGSAGFASVDYTKIGYMKDPTATASPTSSS
jgi:peptide/nickel transport system substrate-binding protein